MVKLQKLWAVTPLKPIASRKPTFLKTVDLLIVCFVYDSLMWMKWELYPVYQLFRSGLFVASFGFLLFCFKALIELENTEPEFWWSDESWKASGYLYRIGHLRTTDDVFFWVFEPVQTKIAGIATQCQKPFLNMYLESIKRYITEKSPIVCSEEVFLLRKPPQQQSGSEGPSCFERKWSGLRRRMPNWRRPVKPAVMVTYCRHIITLVTYLFQRVL